MDLLFEFLLELILEGSIEVSRSRKVSRWIRYPVIVLLFLFILGVLVGIAVVGVYMVVRHTEMYWIPLGIVLLVTDGMMWISAVHKVRRYLSRRREAFATNDEKGEKE